MNVVQQVVPNEEETRFVEENEKLKIFDQFL